MAIIFRPYAEDPKEHHCSSQSARPLTLPSPSPAAACRDDLGDLHPHGSTFVDDPKHPCVTYNCSDGVIAVVDKVSCMALPDGCTPWRMDGFCCPKSDCPESE